MAYINITLLARCLQVRKNLVFREWFLYVNYITKNEKVNGYLTNNKDARYFKSNQSLNLWIISLFGSSSIAQITSRSPESTHK